MGSNVLYAEQLCGLGLNLEETMLLMIGVGMWWLVETCYCWMKWHESLPVLMWLLTWLWRIIKAPPLVESDWNP